MDAEKIYFGICCSRSQWIQLYKHYFIIFV